MNLFDFSGLVDCPSGFIVKEASPHCYRVWHERSKRTYIVNCPMPGQFRVMYQGYVDREPIYLITTSDLRRALSLIGCLHKNTALG